MLYLKSCPRCRGDVKYERDLYGHFMECLQCGYLISSKNDITPRRPAASARGKKTARSGTTRAA